MPIFSELDRPEKQELMLNYIRKHGKIAGVEEIVGLTHAGIYQYLDKHPEFKAKVNFVRENFLENDDTVDLQSYWNRHEKDLGQAVRERLTQLLVEGERTHEVNVVKRPVMKNGEQVLDKNKNPVLEVEKQFEKTSWKPTPKWAMDIFMDLMKQEWGKPDVMKIAPTIQLMLLNYLHTHCESLTGDVWQDVMNVSQDFEKHLAQQAIALKGKN